MEYIKRHIEDFVLQTHKTFKCLLISGARQTGKSTILQKLFPDLRYVTLDDEFIREQARVNPSSFIMLNPPPVLYDEVQYAPQLFSQIKIRVDRDQTNGSFCLSGSQPMNLMEKASESLAGRVGLLELLPLSLREIQLDPFNKPFLPTWDYILERQKTAKTPENVWELIHRGGYPEMQNPDVSWATFYSSYVTTYLERDVRQLTAVQNLNDFRKFMVAVAARTGQLLNYANIADEIGKDEKTIRNWISILQASHIVFVLEPYSSTALNRAIKTPKIYFRDTGLAAYLTRWLTPETLANGAMNGAFFETYVINEILKSYANRGIDYHFAVSYYRGKDKIVRKDQDSTEISGFGSPEKAKKKRDKEQEIDFIIEENGILYPIEIKLNTNPTADESSAFQILDKIPEKKRGTGAIICMCSTPAPLRENLFALPVWYV